MLNIPENIGSKYRFIVIAAQRARQLMLGAQSRVPGRPDEKSVITAMEEVLNEQIKFELTEKTHDGNR